MASCQTTVLQALSVDSGCSFMIFALCHTCVDHPTTQSPVLLDQLPTIINYMHRCGDVSADAIFTVKAVCK